MRGWPTSLLAATCMISVTIAGAFAQDVPPAIAELDDPAEIERVQQLIDGAREEGRLSWLGLFIEPQHGQALIEGFKEHYGLDDLVVEYSYQDSGLIVTQTEQLLAANRDVPDVVWTVAWAWYTDLLNRGELLEYHSPYHAEYTLSNEAGLSKEGYWVSDGHFFTPIYSPSGLASHGVEDFEPSSLADLIDPRIRGLASIPNIPGSTSNAPAGIGWWRAMGEEWYFELEEVVQPVLRGGSAQGRDWVGSGEYPISLMSHAKDAQTLFSRNVDVRVMYPDEGIVMLPFAPVIMEKGTNHNAAKLFIDFAASERGAQIRMDAGVLMFYGRPGIQSINRELLTSWEETPVAAFDWDVDGSLETLAEFRDMFVRTGLGE